MKWRAISLPSRWHRGRRQINGNQAAERCAVKVDLTTVEAGQRRDAQYASELATGGELWRYFFPFLLGILTVSTTVVFGLRSASLSGMNLPVPASRPIFLSGTSSPSFAV